MYRLLAWRRLGEKGHFLKIDCHLGRLEDTQVFNTTHCLCNLKTQSVYRFILKQHEHDSTTYAVFCNTDFAMTNCRIKILGYRCKPSHALNDELTVHLMCIYLLTMCYNPKQTPLYQNARTKA